MENSNKPAFPIDQETRNSINYGIVDYIGLTKREYFAGLAMQSIISGYGNKTYHPERISADAIMIADELLKELEK